MGTNGAGPFRLGLVGAGRMGSTHLRALAESTDVVVTAVAEPVEQLREAAVAAHGLAGFTSLDAMLDAAGIDGVLIVTPSDSHVDVIRTVAQAGLPILCEKPCGVSPEDSRGRGSGGRTSANRLLAPFRAAAPRAARADRLG